MPTAIPELIEEWRQRSIPMWRRIAQESLAAGDKHRATYASWVLRCVLKDTPTPKEWEGLS